MRCARFGGSQGRLNAVVCDDVLEESIAPVAPLVSSATRPGSKATHARLSNHGAPSRSTAKIAIAWPSFSLLTARMRQLTSFAPMSQLLGNGRSTRAACCVRKCRSETSGRRAVAKSGTPMKAMCACLHHPGTPSNWPSKFNNGHCPRARFSLFGRG